MAKIACYTPDGEEKMKEPVDARECVESLGFTMDAPCDKEVSEDQPMEVDFKDEDMDESKPKKKSTKKKKSK